LNVSLYIAKRYLFSKSRNNAINIISIIAAFGVVIGSAALFIVLSGFAGLKDFTLQFTSFVDPDLKIYPVEGKSFLVNNDQLDSIYTIEGVHSVSKVIEERVVVNFETKNEIVTLMGVDEQYPEATIDSILFRGKWFGDEGHQIVAGWGVSNNLAFGLFQLENAIKIYVPKPGVGQLTSVKGAYNSVNTICTGVFQINEELDNTMIYSSIEMAQELLNYQANQITALEVRVTPETDVEDVRDQLSQLMGASVIIKDRFQLNDELYKMLNTENLAVYLIFTLVLVIALFNIIGSIIMMILDKKRSLNTLVSLGVTVPDIRKIFFLQGSLMVILGGLIGLFLGFILILLQKLFGFVLITATLPYPVTIKPINFIIVFLTIAILGMLASKIASVRISKKLVAVG